MGACKCYTCRHCEDPKALAAYLTGYKEACEWFLNWAKRNNIAKGSLGEDTIEGIYAEIDCNYVETLSFLDSLLSYSAEAKEAI